MLPFMFLFISSQPPPAPPLPPRPQEKDCPALLTVSDNCREKPFSTTEALDRPHRHLQSQRRVDGNGALFRVPGCLHIAHAEAACLAYDTGNHEIATGVVLRARAEKSPTLAWITCALPCRWPRNCRPLRILVASSLDLTWIPDLQIRSRFGLELGPAESAQP